MNKEQLKNHEVYESIEDIAKHIQLQDKNITYLEAMKLAEKIYSKMNNPFKNVNDIIEITQKVWDWFNEQQNKLEEARKKKFEEQQAEADKLEDEYYKRNPDLVRPMRLKGRFPQSIF